MGTIIHNQERQRSSGTALAPRWGMYRTTCAVGTTGGRCARLGCHRRGFEFPAAREYDLLTDLAGRFCVRSFSQALSHIDGIGSGLNRSFANFIHNAADHSGNDAVEPLKRHFTAPAVYVPKRRCGVIGSAQK